MARLTSSALCLCAAVVLAVSIASAQRNTQTRQTNCEVIIRVTYDNEHPVTQQMRVDLTNASGISISQTFTDNDGRVVFHVMQPGGYQVKVAGFNPKDQASESFTVEEMDRSRIVYVRMKPEGEQAESRKKPNDGPLTSAAALRVPPDAKKAFHKGLEAWEQKDYAKAAQYFEKATALYPEYDTAYNNLGVMYVHLGEIDKARTAFQKSVQLNDKNADADRNLARLLLKDKQYGQAGELLRKSLVVEPLNPISLTLLSVSEIEAGNLDAGLEDARKVHGVPHDGYALSHYLAGQVLEQKHQYQDASLEYQTYLRESPDGPEVVQVKTALQRLQTAGVRSQASAQ